MIRVLHIISSLHTGGAEMMLYRLLAHMDKSRFSQTVISLIDGGSLSNQIEALGIPVYTVGMNSTRPTPYALYKLITRVNEIRPDVLQGWMYHGNLASQIASCFYDRTIPTIWSIHHSLYSLSYEKRMTTLTIRLLAAMSNSPKKVIYVSKTSRAQHEKVGFSKVNSYLLPNAVDPELFLPSSDAKFKVRTELGLSEDTFLIGLFCRFHPMKDHANFLKAAKLLLDIYSDIHFLLAGSDVNHENQELSRLIQDLKLIDNVHLLGERGDIPRLTSALDIAASASAYGEAFPVVLLEAMSSGIPCVVTNIGDSAEVLANTGRVVPPKNPHALANAWQDLISLGEDRRQELGQLARNRVMEHFSLNKLASQYESLYEDATS